jgi:L-arabinose transport system ATP-binding protein
MEKQELQFDRIVKRFPGVVALDEVSFVVRAGSVHALLGENGAGKSTLLKILSGVYSPDAGVLRIDGEPVVFHSAADAIRAGVAVIYQELQLVPELSVAENLYLGHLPSRHGWVRGRELIDRTVAQLAALGEDINPRARVGSLPIAQRQMIEIAKALSRDAKVIAFDEPSSSLSSREVTRLFAVIRRLKAEGRIILYVSHRMEEIFQICDAATVLRDGRHVQTFASLEGVSPRRLVKEMVGRSIDDVFRYSPRSHGEPALEVRGLLGPGLRAPASLSVARGEILGIFGLVGAGRSELLKLIYGATRPGAGSVQVGGRPVRIRSPRDAIAAGLALCPEDRKREGIVPMASVTDNINLGVRRDFAPLGFLIRTDRERQNAQRFVHQLGVRIPSLSRPIVNLSGGNQQKVILARGLSRDLRAILLDEPTRGIDVGAKSEIYAIIYALARQGAGVVVVSSELPEVLGICDRLLVMRQGAIVGGLSRDEATAENVLELALPVSNPVSGAVAV